jgi:hypothetical protein
LQVRGYAKGEWLDWSGAAYPDPYERSKHLLLKPWDEWPGMEDSVRRAEEREQAQEQGQAQEQEAAATKAAAKL